MYKVKIENKTIDVDSNTTVEELVDENFEKPLCVAAKMNDKLVDLVALYRRC